MLMTNREVVEDRSITLSIILPAYNDAKNVDIILTGRYLRYDIVQSDMKGWCP